MKRGITFVFAVLLAVFVVMSSPAKADILLPDYMDRVMDTEHPVPYIIANLEFGEMTPVDGYQPDFAPLLKQAVLTPVLPEDLPDGADDGQYVVLRFPEDQIRFDFIYSDVVDNLIRQVNPDGSTELFTAVLPEDVLVPVSVLMLIEADALARISGISSEYGGDTSEEGWVAESVNGAVWTYGDIMLLVSRDSEEPRNTFSVQIILVEDENGSALIYKYTCDYNIEKEILIANHVICDQFRYDEKEDTVSEARLIDQESEAVFSLDSEGRLTVWRPGDDRLEGLPFVRLDTVLVQ